MRKLILISAFAITSILASFSASVSAQAGDRSLILAANDTPAAASTAAPAPATATTDTARPEGKTQASKSRGKSHAHRRESDEAKARRIAARYGVYW